MKPITVLVVDDHTLFREGITSILQRAGGRFQVVGEAGDGIQAQSLARQCKPDIILMDVRMPHGSGLEAARVLAPALPESKIVMLTVSDRDEDLFEAIKVGAKGYLLKMTTNAKEMIEALERVAAGEVILTPAMATRLVSEFAAMAREHERGASPASRPATASSSRAAEEPRLTEREREVLELVAAGQTNKEIAAALHITENTVRAHLRNILDKLHVHNRTQAAAYARIQQQR